MPTDDAVKLLGKEAKLLQEDVARHAELADAAQEYAKLDKSIKDRLKQKGAGTFLTSEWKFSVEKRPRTDYEIPDDVKAQYKKEGTSTYVKWEKR